MALFPATETAEAALHLYLWTGPQWMLGKSGKERGGRWEWWQKLRKERNAGRAIFNPLAHRKKVVQME